MKSIFALICTSIIIVNPTFADWQLVNKARTAFSTGLIVRNDSLYFCSTQDLIFSSNEGLTWQILEVPVRPIDHFSGYGNNFYISSGSLLYKSPDYGKSWAKIDSVLNGSSITTISQINENIWIGTHKGIFRSSDDGDHWDEMNVGMTNKDITLFCSANNTIFAGCFNGELYYWSEMSKSWVVTNTGVELNSPLYSMTTIKSNIFLGSSNAVYKSTDGGVHWVSKNQNGFQGMILALSSRSDTLFASTGGNPGIIISTNLGDNWSIFQKSITNFTVLNFALNKEHIFVGKTTGISKLSDDNASWISLLSSSLEFVGIQSMIHSADKVIASNEAGVYASSDHGNSWYSSATGIGPKVFQMITNSSDIIAASSTNGLFISKNNGLSWKQFAYELADTGIRSVAAFGENIAVRCVSSSGIKYSTDYGTFWYRVISDPAGSQKDLLMTSAGLYFCSIYGSYLLSLDQTSLQKISESRSVKFFDVNGNIFASRTNQFIMKFDKIDTTWSTTIYNVGTAPIQQIYYQNGKIFTSDNNGLYKSINNDTIWTNISEGIMGGNYILSMTSDDTYLFAGDNLGNIWRRQITDLTNVAEINKINMPSKYFLYQNYPNPFNPNTTIQYQLPKDSYVTIRIFDQLGQSINTFVNEIQGAGNHTVDFSANNLSSGVYFYQMVTPRSTQTRKMLLMK